ncbi:MAG: hypothetical protein K2N06_07410, partial [Oscillospiraceae bacterium]|nr:hypothetical protein [Oscillospiraceae bacterium]
EKNVYNRYVCVVGFAATCRGEILRAIIQDSILVISANLKCKRCSAREASGVMLGKHRRAASARFRICYLDKEKIL